MSIAKASQPTELDPVVIEYEETVDKIRQRGGSMVDAWIARMRRPVVQQNIEKWRRSQPCPDSDGIKKYLAIEEP